MGEMHVYEELSSKTSTRLAGSPGQGRKWTGGASIISMDHGSAIYVLSHTWYYMIL
jgi:hypothetical protein